MSLSSAAVRIFFISTRKLNFSVSVFRICSPIHMSCIPFPLFMPNLSRPYKIGFIKNQVTFSLSLLVLLFQRDSTMSALSFVVELDGFQHGDDDFVLKCLAVSCGRLRTTYFRLFDTTSLLSRGPAALRTYHYQTRHHGLSLASAGLPQAMARSVLMHAVLEAFMDLSERGDLAPAQVLMWVKGAQKTALVTKLVNTPGFAFPVFSAESGGRGLSKGKRARTSGSWPVIYSGKSPPVQHLADDSRPGLRPSWKTYRMTTLEVERPATGLS